MKAPSTVLPSFQREGIANLEFMTLSWWKTNDGGNVVEVLIGWSNI